MYMLLNIHVAWRVENECIRTLSVKIVQQQFGQRIVGQFYAVVVCLVETFATQETFLPQLQITKESYFLSLVVQRVIEHADRFYRRLYEMLSNTRNSLRQMKFDANVFSFTTVVYIVN